MKVVLIHRYSGILSAFGMALADVVHEEQETCSKIYHPSKLFCFKHFKINLLLLLFYYYYFYFYFYFLLFSGNFDYINGRIELLSKRCIDALISRGFERTQIHTEP